MKSFRLLIFFCCLSSLVNAQNSYTPFPDSNATWQINYWGDNCNGGCIPIYTPSNPLVIQYKLTGDTLVSGITYYKLDTGQTYIGYAGALKQDIPNKKVYYLPPGSTKDTLLYDFNLKVGDTLPQSYIFDTSNVFDNTIPIVVISIDSQLVGCMYYKRFNLSYYDSTFTLQYLLEGIGSGIGLLQNLSFSIYVQGEVGSVLASFSDSGNCDNTTGIIPVDKHTDTLHIFPNPAVDLVTIEFNSSKTGTLELLDAQGRTIKEQPFTGDKTNINLTGLSPGLYLLNITTAEGSSFTKLVKE